MRETHKILMFLTLSLGIALLIGAAYLFYKHGNIYGLQFQGDYMGTGKGGQIRAASLNWQGLLMLGTFCLGIGGFIYYNGRRQADYWGEED
ncbi:MAG: hypothetical protein AAF696_17200 [Bacteroidota bacterium]